MKATKRITTTSIAALTMMLAPFVNGQEQVSKFYSGEQALNGSIRFTPNQGQVTDQHFQPRRDVLYYGQAGPLNFFIRNNGVSYQQVRLDSETDPEIGFDGPMSSRSVKSVNEFTIYRTDINWLGTNPDVMPEPGTEVSGAHHYYLSYCPEGITNVRSFERLTYKELYQGIDLRWYERSGQLEYDFIVGAGVDYRQIRWEVDGPDSLYVNTAGQLVMVTPLGEIVEDRPIAFQGNKKVDISWEIDDRTVQFKVNSHDPDLPLLIDPVVRLWGTFKGGTGSDYSFGCDIGPSRTVYIAGSTNSTSLIATSGTFQTTIKGGYDAFVAKFDEQGNQLWGTYLGGTAEDDAKSCAVDGSGNVFVVGETLSDTALATAGSHQSFFGGGSRDGFVGKFSSSGIRQWVTYIGGDSIDYLNACDLDGAGNLYITGLTYSDTLISSPGSFQVKRAGDWDAYVMKLSGSGVRQWGTYFGSSDFESGRGCVVDGSKLYIVGEGGANSSIGTNGTFQSSSAGLRDAYLASFSLSGIRQWVTFFGGSGNEFASDCAVDDSSNVYITGETISTNGIAYQGHQSSHGGGYLDVFLAKFDGSGSRLWSTYYGGGFSDMSPSCVSGDSSTIYLAGFTNSSAGIATIDAHQTTSAGSNEAFLVKFNNKGVRQWGTFYGGNMPEQAYDCTIDDQQKVYITGHSRSSMGIATPNVHQSITSGAGDAFLAKFATCSANSDTIYPVVCKTYTSPSGDYTWDSTGTYLDTLTNVEGCDSLLTIYLTITPAPVFTSVSPGMVCDSGSTTLIASAAQGTIRWYSDTTSGATSLLGTGRQFVTPQIDSTTVYYAELTDTAGCASYFMPVNASVFYSSSAAISEEACLRYTSPSGRHVFDTSGFYMDTITNAAGCDSVLSIDLVVKTVDATVTQTGTTLEANEPFGLYQWVDCNNNFSPLTPNSSFNRQYQVTNNGSYAVIVTKNGCQDTSACFSINYLGLDPYGTKNEIQIFPNPTSGVLTIELGQVAEEVRVDLINPLGQVLQTWNQVQAAQLHLELDHPSGTYLLKVHLDGQATLFRVVKE